MVVLFTFLPPTLQTIMNFLLIFVPLMIAIQVIQMEDVFTSLVVILFVRNVVHLNVIL